MVDTSDEWIVTRTGIQKRHIASEAEQCSDMAVHAARKALDVADLTPTDLDLINKAIFSPQIIWSRLSQARFKIS